jgi:hypothetical protein
LADLLPLDDGPRPIISIVRPSGVRFSLPWNLVYEIGLPSVPNARNTKLCPSVSEWDERSPLVVGEVHECPRSSDFDHSEDVLCPFGFWGFRQPIEAPPSVPYANAVITVPKSSRAIIAMATSGVARDALNDHVAKLTSALHGRFGTELDVRSVDSTKALHESIGRDLPILYFICHGHREPGEPDTWLALGNNDYMSPGLFVDWAISARKRKEKFWNEVRPLVIVNACHSLDIDADTMIGYLDAFTSGADAKGVIGTEVSVPQPLAMQWASVFLNALLTTGATAETALRQARLSFLARGSLFGLIYRADCWGHLQIVPA